MLNNILMWVIVGLACLITYVFGVVYFVKWLKYKHECRKTKRENDKLKKEAKAKADKDARTAEILKFMKELFGDKK